MLRKCFAGIALLALAQLAPAQPALRFEHLGVEDGLSNPIARRVVQDAKGFLWIATEYGLNRYDGQELRVYEHEPADPHSLPASWIEDLFVDRRGGVWIRLVLPGLTRIGAGEGEANQYLHDPADPHSIAEGHVIAQAIDDDGELWIGTNGGAVDRYVSDAARFVHMLAAGEGPSAVLALLPDRQGGVWVGTERHGLLHVAAAGSPPRRFETPLPAECVRALLWGAAGTLLVATETQVFAFEPQSAQWRPLGGDDGPRGIHSVLRSEREDCLWVAAESGLSRLDPSAQSWTHLPVDSQNEQQFERDGLPTRRIFAMHEDRAGHLWIGTDWGLFARDPASGRIRWHRHQPSDRFGMAPGNVHSILEDRSGVLWFGSVAGVSRFNPRQRWFEHELYSRRARGILDDFSISSIVQDQQGILWVGTLGQGILIYDRDGDRLERLQHDPQDSSSISSDVIQALHLSRSHEGVLWIGGHDGLDRLDLSTRRVRRFQHDPADPHSLGGALVRCLWEDRRGDLWVGLNSGLDRLDAKSGRFEHTPCPVDGPRGIDRCQVFTIHETADGLLWFGVVPTGLHRFDPESGEFHHYALPTPGSALVPHTMHAIHESPDGPMWFGTFSDGLVRFDRETERFTAITQRDGLPSNRVVSILPDDDGSLWLGSNRGLVHFDPATHAIRVFRAADGLQADQFWEGAACRLRSGEFAFGGVDGITTFRPSEIAQNEHVPPIALVSLELSGADGTRAVGAPTAGPLRIGRGESTISFRFAVLDFTVPEQNRYAYRLHGYDRDWTLGAPLGTYRNLPPGRYRLQMRGANSDGVWNEAGISLELAVLPSFWQRGWFHLFALAAALLVVWIAYRARVRVVTARARELEGVRLAERERVRQDAARDLHDELGHLVSRISLSSGIARRRMADDPPAASRHLEQLANTSRSLAEAMGDFLWTLDARSDSLAEVMVRLKDFGDELFRGTGIRFELRGLSRELAQIQFAVDRKRNLTMLFKEAMHNAFKHAEASSVLLEVQLAAQEFTLTLRDDGRGYDPQSIVAGRGMASMRSRAERLGGELLLSAQPGAGSSVALRMARRALANQGVGN